MESHRADHFSPRCCALLKALKPPREPAASGPSVLKGLGLGAPELDAGLWLGLGRRLGPHLG
eukprot:1130580-Alexandrium_andersonii.AAC.1